MSNSARDEFGCRIVAQLVDVHVQAETGIHPGVAAPNDESFQVHRTLGYGIVLFAVLVTILAAVARMPGRLIGMSGLVAGLTVLQGVIRAIAGAFGDTGGSTTAGQLVFGLHAVNGLVILAVTWTIVRQARELLGSAAAVTGTAGPASRAS